MSVIVFFCRAQVAIERWICASCFPALRWVEKPEDQGKFSRYAPMQYLEAGSDASPDDLLFSCGDNGSGKFSGFTALGKEIQAPDSTDKDSAYVTEHLVLKYLRPKLANFLNDFRHPNWFTRFGLPVSNGRHNQLSGSQVRRLMRRVEQRASPKGGGRERPEIQIFSRLDIGHKDFHCTQFVNCRPFGTHHELVRT
jgi:hypothetical protein